MTAAISLEDPSVLFLALQVLLFFGLASMIVIGALVFPQYITSPGFVMLHQGGQPIPFVVGSEKWEEAITRKQGWDVRASVRPVEHFGQLLSSAESQAKGFGVCR